MKQLWAEPESDWKRKGRERVPEGTLRRRNWIKDLALINISGWRNNKAHEKMQLLELSESHGSLQAKETPRCRNLMTFSLVLSLPRKWELRKKNSKQKRKATCNYFHNQTYLLGNCPSALQQPQKPEIRPKPNYHTRLSKRCLLSRQANFFIIFCLVGFFGTVFIYLLVFKSGLFWLPGPLRTPMTRGQDIISSDDKNKRRKVSEENFFPWYTVAEK